MLYSTLRTKVADGLHLPLPAATRRTIRIPQIPNKVKAIIGMRRSGKTVFLYQCMADCLAAGMLREHLLYLNFEDERLAGIQAIDLGMILDIYYQQYPSLRHSKRIGLFLDEIQVVPGWEQFARRILDTESIDLFISGSSARMLSREVATSMRGRAIEAVVYPFSFSEALAHAGSEPPTRPAFMTSAQRSMIEKHFLGYLETGGFPEALDLDPESRRHLLQGYVDSVILRDIAERHGLTNLVAIRWLVRHLLANAGGGFSANRFHRDLKSQGVRVSIESLLQIYDHLCDAFLVVGLHIEASSERKRQVNPRKTYPVDCGLIPVFDRSGRANTGHALECVVLIDLLRRGAEVTWLRTPKGFEIDFVARFPDNAVELIQVSAEIANPETRKRELRAFAELDGQFPGAKRHEKRRIHSHGNTSR